jgi:predicted lactoylglutathione lyase
MLFLVVALREIGVSKMFYGHASFEINQALSNELYAHSIYNDEEALTLFEAYRAVKPIKLVMPTDVSEMITQLTHSIYDYETLLIHAICGAMILYKTNC